MARLIDEAIKHAREVAEENRKQHKTGCLGHIEEYYDAKQRAEEQEQLAEWLEELKFRRVLHLQCEKEFFAGYENGKTDGYNKAIDDFFYELQKYEEADDWLRLKMSSIYKIAQQLKEGDIGDTDVHVSK